MSCDGTFFFIDKVNLDDSSPPNSALPHNLNFTLNVNINHSQSSRTINYLPINININMGWNTGSAFQ